MLLRLTPDGERLRRIAKAHAAGELSTTEYRRIRTDVIESFSAADVPCDGAGDDTQQRWIDSPPAQVTQAHAQFAAAVRPPDRQWRRLVLVIVVLGALLALLIQI